MKAIYANDPVQGPGYGLLYLEDVSAEGTDVRFALIRSGDHKTLHPESWEDTEYRLTPDSVNPRGSGLCLAIGPNIVRQLDELNTYRLVLFPASGSPEKALLELSGIIYPSEDAKGLVGTAPAPKPEVKPAPQPVPAPEPEPQPQISQLPPLAAPAPAKKFPAWAIALLLVLLGLGGAGAAFFLFMSKEPAPVVETAQPEAPKEEAKKDEPKPEEAQPEEAKKAEPVQPETPPAASAQIPQTPQTPPTPPTPMEQARQFLRGNGVPAAGLALSREMPQTPEGRDAAYLLLEASAEQGQPEAMLALGAFYDPVDAQPKGSILPDAEQAWEWYGKAEKAGQAGAADRKKALKVWLEAEAGKGSASARDVLSRIK